MKIRGAFVALATSLLMMGCQDDSRVETSQFEQEAATAQACFQGCEQAAQEDLRECVVAGGDAQSCVSRFQTSEQGCEVRCGTAAPPAPAPAPSAPAPAPPAPPAPPANPSCQEACANRAAQVSADCLRAGGDARSCEARTAQFASSCERGCGMAEPPPNRSCQQVCADRAAQVSRECQRAGGDARACEARAAQVASSCERGCGMAEPPPNRSCQQACANRGAQVSAECLRAGRDARSCEIRVAQFVSNCERGCR
jgi:hypothetical protein